MEKGFIILLVFAVIISLFAFSNSEKVFIDLFVTEVQMSQAIVILVSTLLGATVAAVFAGFKSLKMKKNIKDLNKKIFNMEEEIEQIKSSFETLKEEKDRLKVLVDSLEEDKENLQDGLNAQKQNLDNNN